MTSGMTGWQNGNLSDNLTGQGWGRSEGENLGENLRRTQQPNQEKDIGGIFGQNGGETVFVEGERMICWINSLAFHMQLRSDDEGENNLQDIILFLLDFGE